MKQFSTQIKVVYTLLPHLTIYLKIFLLPGQCLEPTDNPIIESKNGWLKNEMYIDFDINNYNTVQEFIEEIIKDNNYDRPSFSINYKTPIEYRTQLGFS